MPNLPPRGMSEDRLTASEQAAHRVNCPPAAGVVGAFIALAVLAGPVTTYSFTPFPFSVPWPTTTGSAVNCALAALGLLILGLARKQQMLRASHWLVLLVLLLPQWLGLVLTAPAIRSAAWLHETPWGVTFLLSLAAPLWLALLSALQLISVPVPRTLVGATIAGIAAVCLIIPTDAYAITLNQAPMVALQLLLSILTVFTWAYAAPRLAGVGALAAAGSYLLLSALAHGVQAFLFERGSWQGMDWRQMAIPLLVQAFVLACLWSLWFWLLQRMSLAAFSLRALATWTASLLPGLAMLGFLSWRVDVALIIAVTAITIALRARVEEEQPVALGLGET